MNSQQVPSDALIAELAVTAELCGTNLSTPAARAMAEDLAAFPEAQVIGALRRCRRELKGRLTIAEVMSRLEDGRPGPDAAWAMLPWDDNVTAVLTDEMSSAQGIARDAYIAGDRNGARFAFREAYLQLCIQAREARKPVQWRISLGDDKAGREGPIREAIAAGLIAAPEVKKLLGPVEAENILGQKRQAQKLLSGAVPMPDDVRRQISSLVREKALK